MKLFNSNTSKEEKYFLIGGMLLFVAVIIGGIGWIIYNNLPHPDSVNYDCVDFTSQLDAQNYFISQGGSKTNNIDHLDEDGDGTVCETLPRATPTTQYKEGGYDGWGM